MSIGSRLKQWFGSGKQGVPRREILSREAARKELEFDYVSAQSMFWPILGDGAFGQMSIPGELMLPVLKQDDGQAGLFELFEGLDWHLGIDPFPENCGHLYRAREVLRILCCADAAPEPHFTRVAIPEGESWLCPGCSRLLRPFCLLSGKEVEDFASLRVSDATNHCLQVNPFTQHIFGPAIQPDFRFSYFCVDCGKALKPVMHAHHAGPADTGNQEQLDRHWELDEIEVSPRASADSIEELIRTRRFSRAYCLLRNRMEERVPDEYFKTLWAEVLEGLGLWRQAGLKYIAVLDSEPNNDIAARNALDWAISVRSHEALRMVTDKGADAEALKRVLETLLSDGEVALVTLGGSDAHDRATAWVTARKQILERMDKKRFAEALELFGEFEDLIAANPAIGELRARVAVEAGAFDLCVEQVRQLLDLGHRWPEADRIVHGVRMRQMFPGEGAEDAGLAQHDLLLGGTLRGIAMAFAGQEFRRAAELAEQAILSYPLSAALFVELGNARHMLGEHDGAVEAYERALEINPASASCFVNYAGYLTSLSNADTWQQTRAYSLAHRALHLTPSPAEANLARRCMAELEPRLEEHYRIFGYDGVGAWKCETRL